MSPEGFKQKWSANYILGTLRRPRAVRVLVGLGVSGVTSPGQVTSKSVWAGPGLGRRDLNCHEAGSESLRGGAGVGSRGTEWELGGGGADLERV